MRHPKVRACFVVILLLGVAAQAAPVGAAEEANLRLREPVVVNAAAVAQTDRGLIGSVATISISVAENGTGHIFIDTFPLTQVDMQGSARLAVKVAGAITGLDTDNYDFFFVVRSNSQVIGGPSAGAIMTVGTVAALMDWKVNRSVMMTGTINPDGSVGPVGGVPEKAAAAADVGARVFLYPEGQENAVQDGRIVDLGTYCREELRVTCQAVTDVEDAVEVVTGHTFDRPPVSTHVTNERYKAVLGPLARDILRNATAAVDEARSDLADAQGLPSGVRDNLRQSVRRADDAVANATNATASELYYTTASKGFQASIEARYVGLALDYMAAAGRSPRTADAYLDDVFTEAGEEVAAAVDAARAARPSGETELGAIGAAQARASEAERILANAAAIAGNATSVPEVLDALYETAFAVERSRTVGWWLRIGDRVSSESQNPLEPERLQQAALESVEAAEQTVTYAELVLQEAGAPSVAIQRARSLLEDARRDYEDGFFAAATFEALEAEVRGSLALELLGYSGTIPASKVERAREKAAEAIGSARERGVEPILAESYFEFGETLSEPADRLAFYNLARTIARLLEFVQEDEGAGTTPTDSRFVGDSTLARSPPIVPASWALGFLAIGLAAGAAAAAVALASPVRREARPPRGGGVEDLDAAGYREPPPARAPGEWP